MVTACSLVDRSCWLCGTAHRAKGCLDRVHTGNAAPAIAGHTARVSISEADLCLLRGTCSSCSEGPQGTGGGPAPPGGLSTADPDAPLRGNRASPPQAFVRFPAAVRLWSSGPSHDTVAPETNLYVSVFPEHLQSDSGASFPAKAAQKQSGDHRIRRPSTLPGTGRHLTLLSRGGLLKNQLRKIPVSLIFCGSTHLNEAAGSLTATVSEVTVRTKAEDITETYFERVLPRTLVGRTHFFPP